MRVAIQGEPGSNSHLAAQRLLNDFELVPCTISPEVFECLDDGSADAAVLPIENSLHGAVTDHYDLLLKHAVRITGELSLRVRHALIAAAPVPVSSITRVFSHPVALSQCRQFFRSHPVCRAVPSYDTAGSVKQVVASGRADEAAIAAPYAAQVYGGTVLLQDLEDDPQNFTRFFLLYAAGKAPVVHRAPDAAVKVSLAFSIPHRPGSLVRALRALSEYGADLTRIESRPVAGSPWEYVFFVDLKLMRASLVEGMLVALRQECSTIWELGRYIAADDADPGAAVRV